jgi:hypothetical protein
MNHKILLVAESTATPEYSKAFYDEQIQNYISSWDQTTQSYTGKRSL